MSFTAIISGIFTVVFLMILIGYYFLLFYRKKYTPKKNGYKTLSILIPAHNEERYIEESVRAAVNAKFVGKKEIYVVNDGSKDSTKKILEKLKKELNIKVFHRKHSGKSKTINFILNKINTELFAVIDGDSIIHSNSLTEAIKKLNDKTPVVCSVVRVKNYKTFLGMWLHIEQLYNSLMRGLFTKANVNIVTPGPLSIYNTKMLKAIGGFEEKGFGEDIDIAIRFLHAGYRVEYAEKSYSDTYMPVDIKGFTRQRKRFAQGWLDIFKRHLKLDKTFLEIFTLPLSLFSYMQAVFMGIIQIYLITSGYMLYYVSTNSAISWGAAKFFLEWLSLVGTVRWIINIFAGTVPLSPMTIVALTATLLTYPLYIIAILRYDKKITLWHIFPLIFMFPYWLVIMLFYIVNLPKVFTKDRMNIWVKN